MAISREEKKEIVRQYTEQIDESCGLILSDFRGLRVTQMEDLRRSMREAESGFHVVKNRLMKLALADTEIGLPDEWLEGPTAVAFCYGEIPPVAKVLNDFSKDTTLVIKGGFMEEEVLSVDQVVDLASLPAREVLLAQMLGTFNAPATRVASVVGNGVRGILNLLQAYVDKMEEGEGEPAAQAA